MVLNFGLDKLLSSSEELSCSMELVNTVLVPEPIYRNLSLILAVFAPLLRNDCQPRFQAIVVTKTVNRREGPQAFLRI